MSATFPDTLVLGAPTFTGHTSTFKVLGAPTVICTFPGKDMDDIDPSATHLPVTDTGVVDRL
jgi:hypothetical protein